MGQIVKRGLHNQEVEDLIETFCSTQNIEDVDRFTAMTLVDLSTLHSGAIISLGVTEAQLDDWISGRPA